MSEAIVAPGAHDEDERTVRTIAGTATPPRAPALDPMPTFEPDDGGLLHSANVETPRRDSMRRRALAAADMVALLAAYGVLWLVAPPPNDPLQDLPLLAALPMWVVLNKSLRLYDRDANLVHKSSLNELPGIFHSLSLGTSLAFLLGPLIP